MDDKDTYYALYFKNRYQGVFGHGMFEETNFSSQTKFKSMRKYPIFNSIDMEAICEGPIVFGHIHKTQKIRDRIYYTGSLVRSRFGEEEAKGLYFVEYDVDTKDTTFEFIENEITMKYDTIEVNDTNNIFNAPINEQISYFKKLVNDYIKDLTVVSYYEIESNVELQSVGMVTA